ncbi:MAG TPA: sulfurtransferase, partial [Nitratifractor sp.]|nr:sulfurtransferase [Nitratifractor sp.]
MDVNSDTFQVELEKTWKFVEKVNKQFGFVQNPEEERKAADNRICPWKPALEKEIPEDGVCHCGIFCTPEYAEQKSKENSM